MTGRELIQRLAARHTELSPSDINIAVRVILNSIADHLARDGRVEIRGFGSFHNRIMPAKRGRNPKTGEPVMVPEKLRPHFKPGKELRHRIRVED